MHDEQDHRYASAVLFILDQIPRFFVLQVAVDGCGRCSEDSRCDMRFRPFERVLPFLRAILQYRQKFVVTFLKHGTCDIDGSAEITLHQRHEPGNEIAYIVGKICVQ